MLRLLAAFGLWLAATAASILFPLVFADNRYLRLFLWIGLGLGLGVWAIAYLVEMAKRKRQPRVPGMPKDPPPLFPGIRSASVLIGGGAKVGRAKVSGIKSKGTDVAVAITGESVKQADVSDVEHEAAKPGN